MLRVVLLCVAVACVNAIVCSPFACHGAVCSPCLGGIIRRNGGYCGCCDLCFTVLAEGDNCMDPDSVCGQDLICDRSHTHTCQQAPLMVSRKQIATQTCAERRQQILSAQTNGLPLLGQFIPQCDNDGSYSARQCHGSVCYCVDPSGTKIQGYEAHIGEAANMDCRCARDQYAYMQTGLIGKMFSCTQSGSYQRYACTGSVCYCADNLGGQLAGSPTVNIGDLGSLQC